MQKKKNRVWKTITIEPVDADIHFYYSEKFSNITNELNKDKKTSKWLAKHAGTFPHPGDHSNGCIIKCEDDYPILLWIRHRKHDWKFYETIMHEVNHIVEGLARFYKFENEFEFKAYLTTYIFKKIRTLV